MQKELSNIFTPIERSSLDCQKSFALVWFRITTPSDWLKKTRATLSSNQRYKQNQSWLDRTRFPALCVGYMYLLWNLTGLLDCLCNLWSTRGFGFTTLNWNHSNLKKKMNVINTHSHMGLIKLSWPITSLFLDAAHFYSLIQFSSPLLIACQHITRVKKQ